MSQIQKISPSEVAQKLANGATLIDIRSPDEFARTHINGAVCMPIDSLDKDKIAKNTNQNGDNVVIFHCLSGMRTAQNANKLPLVRRIAPFILWTVVCRRGKKQGYQR